MFILNLFKQICKNASLGLIFFFEKGNKNGTSLVLRLAFAP